jgi:RNA polymerase sigma-70 factor (ECF subfamily)
MTDPGSSGGGEPADEGAAAFERLRPTLLALAYRMLGEVQRAEDIVQDAWLRWQRHEAKVESPKAFLIKVVTRLCLNELDSARARREEGRGDRLPEPLDLDRSGLDRVEALDQISMAFIVVLQRLTPAERAVLLLHEVFDFEHDEIADLVGKSEPACRQLLKRARDHVATERRALTVAPDVHRRLLRAFLRAATTGDRSAMAEMLSADVVLVADAGPEGGSYGGVRNVAGPVVGAAKVAAFVASVAPRGAAGLETFERDLNGQPAIVGMRDGRPSATIQLSVADGRVRAIFIQADPLRLRHLAVRRGASAPSSPKDFGS